MIAILVSYIVDQAARRARVARRATAEAELGSRRSRAASCAARARCPRWWTARAKPSAARACAWSMPDGTVIATDGEPVRGRALHRRCPSATSPTRARSSGAARAPCTAPSDGSSMSSSPSSTRRSSAPTSPRPREKPARSSRMDQVRTALALRGEPRPPPPSRSCRRGDRRPPCCGREPVGGGPARTPTRHADESLATLSTLVTDLLDVQPRPGRRARRVIRRSGCRRRRGRIAGRARPRPVRSRALPAIRPRRRRHPPLRTTRRGRRPGRG